MSAERSVRSATHGSMTPTPPDEHNARRFEAVRSANRSETAEDYVEAIDDLLAQNGEARVRDLAALFGVSHVTVSRTVVRLQRDGLVETEPYRSIELTRAGRAMAAASRERHAQVLALLLSLGVEAETAEQDAEGIEHHVGPDTQAAFARFVDARAKVSEAAPPTPTASDAERFARVRQAHASEITEDYVEAISDLIAESGSARVGDLARRFGVSHATVSRTVGRLQRDGYVETEPDRPVTLTPLGEELAARSRERHERVLRFLRAIGVPEEAAEIDAEGIEHHVSERTLEAFDAVSQRGTGS
ncbi:MAG: manganese-binding transcriptional regulator MntR [Planctomycetota bacterium]|nr:manganese-binding transcriptional regulator MntR [Planctomycetota bacterium]